MAFDKMPAAHGKTQTRDDISRAPSAPIEPAAVLEAATLLGEKQRCV